MSMASVYVIFASAEEAERIGRKVVEERLAACINILGPVRSIYRWNGSVETADEVAAFLKTSQNSVDALVSRIAAMHSYDVPCVTTWQIDRVLQTYCDWVEDSTG